MPKISGLRIVRLSLSVDPGTAAELRRRARARRIGVSQLVRELVAQLRAETAVEGGAP